MSNEPQLAGRTAVVVGAGSLVGRGVAAALADAGAEVLVVDPDVRRADEVVAEISSGKGSAIAFVADIASAEGASLVAEECTKRWGVVDVLFTAQAMLDYQPASDSDFEHWRRILEANVLGPVAYTYALMPLLRASAGGSIIYLSSIDGLMGNPTYPAYSTSKGALVPLTHVMAHEGSADGVRVNAIAMAAMNPLGSTDPAPVPMSDGGNAASQAAILLGRFAQPADVGQAAVFFASPTSSYITGQVLTIDGGRGALTPGTGAGSAIAYEKGAGEC